MTIWLSAGLWAKIEMINETSHLFEIDRARWNAILESLNPLKKMGWEDYGNGNLKLGHEPKDYPLYYHVTLYQPLNIKTIDEVENQSSKAPYLSTRNFYFMSNGLRLFGDLSIYGVIGNSYTKAGQPICLRYGNINEIPYGLPKNSMVIGGVHAANDRVDYLVSHQNGQICQSHGLDAYREVRHWPTIFDLLEESIAEKMTSLDIS
ncbi:MAG: hypothetical protein ABJN69_04350 [Hellea sp.]